jgi:hypothetical protein
MREPTRIVGAPFHHARDLKWFSASAAECALQTTA